MTATLDDTYAVGHVWLGKNAKILMEGLPRQIDSELLDISPGTKHDPYLSRAQAIERWLNVSNLEKLLIFANSRNAAHSLAAYLHRELNPHFSPSRLLLSETYLLSISYSSLSTMTRLHTTLDASLLVFFAPAGTCFLNRITRYAFGRRHPLAQKIRRNHRIAW